MEGEGEGGLVELKIVHRAGAHHTVGGDLTHPRIDREATLRWETPVRASLHYLSLHYTPPHSVSLHSEALPP